jgi:hypothetical protein
VSDARLALRVETEADAPDEELDRLTGRLRDELLDLDVADVKRGTAGQAPAGARGIDPEALGHLLVTLATAPATLRAVVGTVRAWLNRSAARSVKLELDGDAIEVTGVSSADQQRLIDQWIERHS